MRSRLLGLIGASGVFVLFFGLTLPRAVSLGPIQLASGTCYEIHQGTLTPGQPITVCT
jgi:hypothetical protein